MGNPKGKKEKVKAPRNWNGVSGIPMINIKRIGMISLVRKRRNLKQGSSKWKN